MKTKLKIKKGDKYGILKIVEETSRQKYPNGQYHRKFICLCECGNKIEVVLQNLTIGCTKSCGCIPRKPTHVKHLDSKNPLYRRYAGILTRCNNPNDRNYHNYGGRGIKCEWSSYEEFKKDMGNSFKKELSIDRIDVNGNYSKDNCRWVSRKVQDRNLRRNLKYLGECAKDASDR